MAAHRYSFGHQVRRKNLGKVGLCPHLLIYLPYSNLKGTDCTYQKGLSHLDLKMLRRAETLAINMNPPQRSIVTALTRFGRERYHNGAKKQLNLALSEIICLFLVILPQRLHNGAKKVCILILNILRRRFFLNTHQINWQTQSHNPKSIVVLF